jgi:hypothetical protein
MVCVHDCGPVSVLFVFGRYDSDEISPAIQHSDAYFAEHHSIPLLQWYGLWEVQL